MKPKTKIVFSIPVHENPSIVKNQIENIFRFVPDSFVVLHISLDTRDNFIKQSKAEQVDFNSMQNVYVNPISLQSTYGQGLLTSVHVSNFNYISEQISFDYFVLESSNTMICRYGLERHISNYGFGADYNPLDLTRTEQKIKQVNADLQLMKILKSNNWQTSYNSQIEGTFYKKDIFEKICSIINEQYPVHLRGHYGNEEVIFPTICFNITKDVKFSGPYVDFFWGTFGLPNEPIITTQLIDSIFAGTYKSPYDREVFGVKRVNRNFNSIRHYITNLKMKTLIEKITERKIDYEHIKNEDSHILLFDDDQDYDVNVIVGTRGRKEFLNPIVESFNEAIKHSDKKICFTIVNHAEYPEHLKYCKTNKINYIWTKGNIVDQYSRSFVYNFGVKYGNRAKHYLLHDLDVLVKENFFSELYQNLKDYQCIQTYGGRRILYLSEELTKKVISKEADYNTFNETTPEVSPPMYNGKPALGSKGGSILISKDLFFEVGGFDPELFWGYAAEDQFFWEKVKIVSEIAYADNPSIDMFHMWHPPSFSTNPLLYSMEADWLKFKDFSVDEKKQIVELKKNLFNV